MRHLRRRRHEAQTEVDEARRLQLTGYSGRGWHGELERASGRGRSGRGNSEVDEIKRRPRAVGKGLTRVQLPHFIIAPVAELALDAELDDDHVHDDAPNWKWQKGWRRLR